jgi:hypothetical protein
LRFCLFALKIFQKLFNRNPQDLSLKVFEKFLTQSDGKEAKAQRIFPILRLISQYYD